MTEYSPLLALFALAPELRKASDQTLSIYVEARAEGYEASHYGIVFRALEHRYADRLSPQQTEVVNREMPRLRAHLSLLKPAGCPALAGFADEASGVLRLIPLRAPTENRLEVGAPLFAPILRQLEEFPPALIVAVDKDEARIYAALLGDMLPREHLSGAEVVRHSRSGGTSAESNQRKADNHATANLERFVGAVEVEMKSGAYQGLYIAGPREARKQFEGMLPDHLGRLVLGRIPAHMASPTLQHELRERLVATAPASS